MKVLLEQHKIIAQPTVVNRVGGGGTVSINAVLSQPSEGQPLMTFIAGMFNTRAIREAPVSYASLTPIAIYLEECIVVAGLRPVVRGTIEWFGPQRVIFGLNFPIERLMAPITTASGMRTTRWRLISAKPSAQRCFTTTQCASIGCEAVPGLGRRCFHDPRIEKDFAMASVNVDSEISGKVWKLVAPAGTLVEEEDTIVVIESMKIP